MIGKDRQQREIGVVEDNRQINLLVGTQVLTALRRKRTQRERPVGTRHIPHPINILRHDELFQMNDRIAQLRLNQHFIEGVSVHTAILRHEMQICLRVLRIAANMRRQRCRPRHLFRDVRKTRKETDRNIRRRNLHIRHAIEVHCTGHGECARSLFPRKGTHGQHAIRKRHINFDIADRIGGKRALRDLTRQCNGRVVERAAELYLARDLSGNAVLFLIRKCKERPHIHLRDVHCAAQRPRLGIIVQTRRHRAVRPLTEPRILKLDDPVFIVGETADLREFHAVHRNRIRLQLPAENRMGNGAPDLAVKDTMSRDLVGQLVLEALHVEITHFGVEVEQPLRIDCAVQHHIHHRRIDVEYLHADDAAIEEVVAVHTRENSPCIATAIKVHIADRVGIVECSRELDDVVNVARDRLIGRDKRRHILHACAHRIDLQIDTPLPREADRSVYEPDLTSAALHREIIDTDSRERTVRAEEQAVKRLIHEITVRRRNAQFHIGVMDISMHFAAEIRQSRKAQAIIQRVQQREVNMPAIKVQIERGTADDAPLDAKIRIIREVQAEKVNRHIIFTQHKGRARTLHGNIAVGTVRHLRTAVDRKSRPLRPLPADAEVGVQSAVHTLRQWHICRAQPRKHNAVGGKMCRIGFAFRIENARTRKRTAKKFPRQILK